MIFSYESQAEKLWVPTSSSYNSDKEWTEDKFSAHTRNQLGLFVASDNVLSPESLLEMLELHNEAMEITSGENNQTWQDICYRIPVSDIFLSKRKRKKRQVSAIRVNTTFEVIHNQSIDRNIVAVKYNERTPKSINAEDLSESESEYEDPWADYYGGEDYQDYFENDPVSDAAILVRKI